MELKKEANISLFFPRILQFCLNYAIFDELCEKLRFEVNYVKSQHRRISEALYVNLRSLLHVQKILSAKMMSLEHV